MREVREVGDAHYARGPRVLSAPERALELDHPRRAGALPQAHNRAFGTSAPGVLRRLFCGDIITPLYEKHFSKSGWELWIVTGPAPKKKDSLCGAGPFYQAGFYGAAPPTLFVVWAHSFDHGVIEGRGPKTMSRGGRSDGASGTPPEQVQGLSGPSAPSRIAKPSCRRSARSIA